MTTRFALHAGLALLPLAGGCFASLAPPQPADAQAAKGTLQAAERARAATQQMSEQQRRQDQQVQRLQPR